MRGIRLTLALASALCAGAAGAQSIDVGELGAARDLAAGLLDAGSGGLDRLAWSGTTAATATRLSGELPAAFAHPVAERLARAALLSSAEPPSGTEEERAAWRAARTRWLLASGDTDSLDALASRDPALARDDRLQSDLALLGGDMAAACDRSDARREGRAEPYWARLRAVCHLVRDEGAAAEVTVRMVSGDPDPVFDRLFRAALRDRPAPEVEAATPLHRALLALLDGPAPTLDTARRPDAAPEDRLAGALADMDATNLDAVRPVMADLTRHADGAALTLDAAEGEAGPRGTAALYTLAVAGDARAAAAFLQRMDTRGRFADAAAHLSPVLRSATYDALREGDPGPLVRAAVLNEDLTALAAIYRALEQGGEAELAARVALVSDALGGGFLFTPLGEDISARLASGGPRAVEDAVLALALGAQLSPDAARTLEAAEIDLAVNGPALVLSAVAESGARAETALRASRMLERGGDPATVLRALREAGLEAPARQLGAWTFARGLGG